MLVEEFTDGGSRLGLFARRYAVFEVVGDTVGCEGAGLFEETRR
jgi:hypothetical protein